LNNPFAYVGRIDCKGCKKRKFSGVSSRKVSCTVCKDRTFIPVCLICDNHYPKQCSCYDWMYGEDWYQDAIRKKKKKIA